jgi:hypothetical protein
MIKMNPPQKILGIIMFNIYGYVAEMDENPSNLQPLVFTEND